MKLSFVIPAHNEQENIGPCLDELLDTFERTHPTPHEIIVVDDNSRDRTAEVVREYQRRHPQIRLVRRQLPAGFGRAIRAGLAAVQGAVVIIYMADLSDSPADALRYYQEIVAGCDCVYGSRFLRGSRVEHYPWLKLWVNRLVNTGIRWLFWTEFNDLTNAFKAYRTEVIHACGPYSACHFNITLEMSLGALNRDYRIRQIPISWYGRQWGSSKLRLREMGRRYLATLLMTYGERLLIRDDLVAEQHGSQLMTIEPPLTQVIGTTVPIENKPTAAEG
jgi:dolichol-phosphate mannosyltransferase